ncbi:MAG: tungsten formylmethanofuran dehydrogenase [Ignavibacteria bacterium GWA2_54_16]|nr:MAG: tungsten formylmethanofuran dehydrogenase [Ignavibacteria bacterium GWA2_54_16]
MPTLQAHESVKESRELLLPKDELLRSYRTMLAARRADEKILILLKQGKCFFHIGGSGHEAAQVAAASALKPGHDWAFPYYRDMAFALHMGHSLEDMFLISLHRAEDPATGGRLPQGHFGRKDLRIPTQSSPTGTQYLQAVGVALGARKERTDEVVYVSSGEGATSEGEFFEAVNWAAREALPVIFFVQDNKYAISVPVHHQTAGGSVYEVVGGFKGLDRHDADGSNFAEIYNVTKKAVDRARSGGGPTLIRANVVRLLAHSSSDDQLKYRSKEEVERDKASDPIPKMTRYLIEEGVITDRDAIDLQQEVKEAVDAAALWAESRPLPDAGTATNYVYGSSHARSPRDFVEPQHTGAKVVLVDAINHALKEEMAANPRMLVFGEDVADGKGGVFTATKGISTAFGTARAFNTPLAEASIIGVATGLALKGWMPVPEIQFADYIWPAFMQIRDEIAMFRYRSNDTWMCPMVIRVPVGGYIHGGHYHSQCIEGLMAHVPGLRLAFPSNAADAKGLLKAALHGDDPVIFMEHKGLYRQAYASSAEPDASYVLPFGIAGVKREGSDITVLTYGALVQKSLEAAKKMEDRGTKIEVIDLRTINPLDLDTITKSVKKTGKALIAHEDTLTGGFGAEIAALIAQHCFESLDAPVMRVAALDAPVPYSPPLENEVLPSEAKILAALEELAAY